uniref:Uncharacterized protein n=1 Tax=Magallana gigas TaxID=29159 RepID=K1QFK1_MAGGI
MICVEWLCLEQDQDDGEMVDNGRVALHSFRMSNCHSKVATVLRQHYNRPYFLPVDSKSSRVDWIFMGGPGPGAFVHFSLYFAHVTKELVLDTNQWYHATYIHPGEISITIGSEYN